MSEPASLENIHAALLYPESGFSVFPCHYVKPDGSCSCGAKCGRTGKHPRTKHGYKDASRDSGLIKAWWTSDSHSNIAVACGMSGLVVLDVDPRNGGDDGLAELEKERGEMPATLVTCTGGGGLHYIYRVPEGVEKVRSRLLKQGVEVKSDGAYVLLPPSNHASGRKYIKEASSLDEPSIAPLWLCESPKRYILSDRAPLDGILGAAFIAAAMAGPPAGPDKIFVRCPWSSEHTGGTDFDGSTLVFAPTLGNFGWFYCAHAHCLDRFKGTTTDVRNSMVLSMLPTAAVEAAKGQVKNGAKDIARLVREPWEKSLGYGPKGELSSSPGNLALLLGNSEIWKGTLAHDESKDLIYWAKEPPAVAGLATPRVGRELDEYAYIYVGQAFVLERNVAFKKDIAQDVMVSAAKANRHNSLMEHLSALQWDGEARLDTWLTRYMNAADTPYSRFVGAAWLISAVARAYSPGVQVDHTLVLESRQGEGKTSAFRILGREWYLGSMPRVDDKDARHILVASWICEIQELAAFRGVEAQRIKAFLTDRVDKYRPAYGRFFVERQRSCVFCASTNEGDYIQDTTGARRFWPVKVHNVDLNGLERDRDNLMAEAREAYLAGRLWYAPRADVTINSEIVKEQEERHAIDPWDERVMVYAKARPLGVRLSDILQYLEVPIDRQTRADSGRLGSILRRNGWVKLPTAEGFVWHPANHIKPEYPSRDLED